LYLKCSASHYPPSSLSSLSLSFPGFKELIYQSKYSVVYGTTFQRNALSPSSWSKNKQRSKNNHSYVGLEILTAVVMIWDITLCSPLKVSRCFGGTYRLHLQGRNISRARNQLEGRWQAIVLFKQSYVSLLFGPEDRGSKSSETSTKFYQIT
jgi:hypothetical protein